MDFNRFPNMFVTALLLACLLTAQAGCDNGEPMDEKVSSSPSGGMATAAASGAQRRHARLEQVESWFYYLSFDPEDGTFKRLADSSYDMVVMEPVFTDSENTDFDTAAVIQNLHGAKEPKLVIAYIDIGEAEDWRTYWRPGWKIGDPDWIVADDPDGWEGNYPVAYWDEEWQRIWLGDDGYVKKLIDAGFDGVYLDWVEAYSDEGVIAAAERDGVDPRREMVAWVSRIAGYGRERDEDFIVISQNAAELSADAEYAAVVDAIAQEQTWFDGGADNDPPGDCPLPRTEDDINSEAYENSLSDECRRTYKEYPDSTLHVSSEEYISMLRDAQSRGLVIFTVDYAQNQANIDWVYRTSRGLGFVPFVGERELGSYMEPFGQ